MSTDIMQKLTVLANHPRCQEVYVVRAATRPDGVPYVETVAYIYIVRPPPGKAEGRLRLGVRAWNKDGTFTPHYGEAYGFGYDKVHTALCGAKIEGRTVHPAVSLQNLAAEENWTVLGL